MDIDGHVVELYTPTSVTESVCPHLGAPPITNHAADCERSCEIACELSSSWQPWAAALLLVLLACCALLISRADLVHAREPTWAQARRVCASWKFGMRTSGT